MGHLKGREEEKREWWHIPYDGWRTRGVVSSHRRRRRVEQGGGKKEEGGVIDRCSETQSGKKRGKSLYLLAYFRGRVGRGSVKKKGHLASNPLPLGRRKEKGEKVYCIH